MSLSLDLKVERESQFNTAGGSEFQVRGVAVPNDRLANNLSQPYDREFLMEKLLIM